MAVREATPDDAEAVLAAHVAAIDDLGPRAYDEQQVAAWRDGRTVADYDLDPEDGVFLVAEREGGVVGFGSLAHTPGDHLDSDVDGEVTGVYVHPEHARAGVGTALLTALERRARDRGAASLGLWASLNAVGFYERHGYERVTDHETEFAEGVPATVVEMHGTV